MSDNLLLLAKAGFLLLSIVYYSLLVRMTLKGIQKTSWTRARKKQITYRIVSGLALWFVFIGFWSLSGLMSDFERFPLNLLPVLFVPLIASFAIVFARSTGEVLVHIRPSAIIMLQSFRFFVEILLWVLFLSNELPVQMTFEGQNYDVIAGLTAPVVAWIAAKGRMPKAWLIVWNIGCLALLINIVTIAILSTPSPLRVFLNEPANTVVALFPISLLPGFLVPLAYTLHFFSLRQLLQRSRATW